MEDKEEPLRQMYQDLGEALRGLTESRFTGTSENEYVTVTADHAGVPVDVELNPRIRRLDTDDIREAIMQAMAAAREEARSTKEEKLRSVFGPSYSSKPSPSEGELEHTQSMITTVGRHAREKYRDRPGPGGAQ